MIGQVFGQRTVTGEARPSPYGKRWRYRCACGNVGIAYAHQLRGTTHCYRCNRGAVGRHWAVRNARLCEVCKEPYRAGESRLRGHKECVR